METIYKITGGGERVIENVRRGVATGYVKVENSDWVDIHGCCGQDFSTDVMWNTDLERLQQWANDWTGCEVELVEVKEDREPFI